MTINKQIKDKYRELNQLNIIRNFHNRKGNVADEAEKEVYSILQEIKELQLKKKENGKPN